MVRKVNKIHPKLERFLLTVARRCGVKSICMGAIILSKNKVLLDLNNSIPTREASGRDLNGALVDLIERIGIEEFSIKDYVGGFLYDNGFGELAKNYYFIIEVEKLPDKLENDFVDVKKLELVKDEEKIIKLALERSFPE
ncbi:MAG: hypothetical protein WCT31_02070 [Candidatus Micrarchaeia archaeon]|jgi:hypothetical protein